METSCSGNWIICRLRRIQFCTVEELSYVRGLLSNVPAARGKSLYLDQAALAVGNVSVVLLKLYCYKFQILSRS